MDKKIINRRRVIILSCCVLLAAILAIVFWPDSGLDERPSHNPEENAPHDPAGHHHEAGLPAPAPASRIVYTSDTGDFGGDFYDVKEIERGEGYSIARVLAQTHDGYMLALVLPPGWPPHDAPQLPNHIVKVSQDFEEISYVFNEPPDWDFFHFAAADKNGAIYVLGESDDGFLALYIYDKHGNETARHEWSREFSVGPSRVPVNVVGDMIIKAQGDFVFILSIYGEVLYGDENVFFPDTPEEFTVYGMLIDGLVSSTVGGDHLYMQMWDRNAGQYFLRKLNIYTREVVWEEFLPYFNIIDTPFAMAFDESNQLLYFLQTQGFYVFDEKTWSMREVKDLQDTEFYRFVYLHGFHNVIHNSFFITREGLLHTVQSRNCCEAHLHEWLFVRLDGTEAETRQDEIRQELADRDFISVADRSRHSTHDHLRELARRQDILLNLDALGNGGSIPYVEQLIAALYGGNAQWDMIWLPLLFVDLPRLVEAGLLANILDFVGPERFSDDSMYYANFFTHSQIDGALYFIPHLTNVPVLFVCNDYHGIDALRTLSLTWTWADFLNIVQNVYMETGIPPITAPDAFRMWSIPLFNVPPFYLYNEDVLFNIANDREAFSQTLDIYKTLANPTYSMDSGQVSVFTFSEEGLVDLTWGMQERGMDFSQTHTVLPLPTMYGERPFTVGSAYGFLQSGQHVEPAIAIAVEYFDIIGTDTPQATAFRALSSATRPSAAALQLRMTERGFHYAPDRLFADDAAIRSMANTRLTLPWSVTDAIRETVESFVHGVVSLEYAVERIADIMWFYMNE